MLVSFEEMQKRGAGGVGEVLGNVPPTPAFGLDHEGVTSVGRD